VLVLAPRSLDIGDAPTSVSHHHSWSLHQVGDLLHYMQPPFGKWAQLYHRSSRLLQEVGRGYANV
jgi:hypothetical protein